MKVMLFSNIFMLGPFDFVYIVFGYCMNILMSNCRSIELRKNLSGSYKARLTIYRGSKFCGARKSLGLGTHREECALRRVCLMRCLLFHLGWFPGGRIAVKRLAGKGVKETFWASMDCPLHSGMFRLSGRGSRQAEDETLVLWYEVNGEARCLRVHISGWRREDRAGDLRVLIQGLQHCATEQLQYPCRITGIETGSGPAVEKRDECVLEG